MRKKQTIDNLLQFYIAAEKLKTTMRHSWTNDITRQESAAEHSWLMSLIALTLFEYIDIKIDQLKTLKLIIVHDLAEAVTGDIPAFEISDRQNHKKQSEAEALQQLTKNVSSAMKKEIINLWSEFEDKKTPEAKLAQIIDKLEVALQHCIADISTWDEGDFNHHGAFYKLDYSQTGEHIALLRDAIGAMSVKKITNANQLDRLNEELKKRI